jgi:hypothetical protein
MQYIDEAATLLTIVAENGDCIPYSYARNYTTDVKLVTIPHSISSMAFSPMIWPVSLLILGLGNRSQKCWP